MSIEDSGADRSSPEPDGRTKLDDDDTLRARRALVRSIEADARFDPRVIRALLEVPRHVFVPEHWRYRAYDDVPLLIGHGQTISQPAVVAMMTRAVEPLAHHVVLEVGTGSGYQAAVLSRLVRRVETMEVVEVLAQRASDTFALLGYENIGVHMADGYAGLPALAPFDGIVVTAAPEQVPAGLLAQLRDGGKMVVPVGPRLGVQELLVIERRADQWVRTSLAAVRFVPMVSAGRGG